MSAFNPEQYTHESDRAALKALQAIPGFSALLKGFMNVWNERQQKILNMSSRIRLGENQMRKYYDMLPPVCEKLGIPVPELYLEMNVVPNSYTSGDTNPFIVITSGLLKALPDELIPTVLAHECGHIACRHVLYLTMGRMVLQGAGSVVSHFLKFGGLLTVPMQIAFYYWMRCSEFSADRAAVLCDGTPRKMQEVCMRMAGWDKEISADVNMEAFLRQASGYKELINESKWNKTLEFMILSQASHPLTAVRAVECGAWAETEEFRRLLLYPGPEIRTLPAAVSSGLPEERDPGTASAPVSGSSGFSGSSGSSAPAGGPLLSVPETCRRIESKPSDPPGSVTWGQVTAQTDVFVQVWPEDPDESFPFGQEDLLLLRVRRRLEDDEGIIEVRTGVSAAGKEYAWSITKSRRQPRSTEYRLTMRFRTDGPDAVVSGYFLETGSPGFREAAVKGQLRRERPETDVEARWSRDPYDPFNAEGFLMNESEKAEYDARFPLHALSEARKFAARMTELN